MLENIILLLSLGVEIKQIYSFSKRCTATQRCSSCEANDIYQMKSARSVDWEMSLEPPNFFLWSDLKTCENTTSFTG